MEKHGPWTTLQSETVHNTPWIRVDHHKVLNPSGKDGQYSTVHFKNLAIGIIPIDKKGNIYLVGQYRYPIKQYSWEIPEGGGQLNVAPLDAAKRELKEEIGVVANTWTPLLESHLSNSATDEYMHLFLAQDLEFYDPEPEEDEELVTKKIALDTFFEMVEKREITDSLTVMAALKIENMILKGQLNQTY